MIYSAAHFYGVLFKYAHIGGSFSCIEKLCFATFQKLYHAAGIGSYAAHPLKVVQSGALARKKYADIARYFGYMFAPFNLVAVLFVKLDNCCYVEQRERAGKNTQSADYAVLFTYQIYRAFFIFGHNGVRGYVFVGDILLKRHLNKLVRMQFFSYGVVHFQPPLLLLKLCPCSFLKVRARLRILISRVCFPPRRQRLSRCGHSARLCRARRALRI